MTRSLRSKLLINTACISTAVSVCAAVVLFGLIRRNLWSEFDSLLATRARALATMVEQDGDQVDIEFHDHPLQEFARQERPEYYQIWNDDGAVLARSRRLETTDLERLPGSLVEPGIAFTTLPDGRRGRCATVRFLPRVDGENFALANTPLNPGDDDDDLVLPASDQSHVTLVIARETAGVDDALAVLAWTLAGVLATAILLTIAALAWIVTRNLRPLGSLATQIGSTDVDSLSSRFSLDDAPRELQPVVDRLNELLARMEESFVRERSFSANLAHELRTPLAGIRATLDVTLSRKREAREYRESLQACQVICAQTQQLVCALLEMVRLESGQGTVDFELVDADLAIEKAWKPFLALAEERQVVVTRHHETGILLQTDADLVHLLFTNLMENAITYVDNVGWISMDVSVAASGLRFEIANSGCQLTPEQQSRAFERFWRADVARADTGTHAGLGLALCRRIVSLLGATIEIKVTDGAFTAMVGFPSESVVMSEPVETNENSAVAITMTDSVEAMAAGD